ncbi:MAG: S41 family peptidase, partial [Candidatus Cloacimonetes bacterium]|nr:S41 family peptidase [Candidatus Cloacimonadota bacterium]
MTKILKANKITFYVFILIWFITGSIIFNYSIVNAASIEDKKANVNYRSLFTEVLWRLQTFYVDELPQKEMIEYAIDGMRAVAREDSVEVEHFIFLEEEIDSNSDQRAVRQRNEAKYFSFFEQELKRLISEHEDTYSMQDFLEGAIEGMLYNVDPHTNFFSPEDFDKFKTETEGEFGGLGITIDTQGDYITVVSPMEGTPAYKMGILPGDKIVTVDGVNVVGMPQEDVIKRMRGPKDTKVIIGIDRPGVPQLLEFNITRDIIKLKSIPYAFKLDNGVGYIKLRTFNAHTTTELREALNILESEGISGLLLDLRFNGGGLLTEAVDTVNEFIGPGKLVVSTKGRMPQSSYEIYTKANRMRSGYPIVVLINEASASASEIFAGSLQDWDKGLIAGKQSFGKGSVQQLVPLSQGYGLKVTVSKYYIKSGRCIHKDINDKLFRGKKVSQEERDAIAKDIEEHSYFTENGRRVKGGGGIVPDIEIDAQLLGTLERELRRNNLFFEYSIDYYTKHSDSLTLDFTPDENMMNEFLALATEKGITWEQTALDSAYTFIETSL